MASSNLPNAKGNAPIKKVGHTSTNAFGADVNKKRSGAGTNVSELNSK